MEMIPVLMAASNVTRGSNPTAYISLDAHHSLQLTSHGSISVDLNITDTVDQESLQNLFVLKSHPTTLLGVPTPLSPKVG